MIPPIANVKTLSGLSASCIVTNNLLHKPEAEALRAPFFIKCQWDELKRESHPVIQNRMTDIENKLALSCPLDKRESFLTDKVDALFRELANVFGASQFFGNTIPVDSVSYHQLLQKCEDEALLVLWNKGVIAQLEDQVPTYTSAQEIRAHLTDPSNTPLLQQITLLDLSDSGLKVIPPEIQNFPNLLYLFLGNNQISVIPEAIGNLAQLQRLYLYENQISFIPEAIGNLVQLQQLYLSCNQISHIPDAIVNCPQQLLELYNNPILFIYNTSSLSKSPREIKQILNAFKDYDCRSAFSRFFKLVALKPESQEGIKEAFQQLKPEDQNLIFEMVCAEAGVASDNLKWGEHHAFDNMPIFYRSLRKAISTKFDRLPPKVRGYCASICISTEDREKFAKTFEQLADSPVDSLAEWVEHHAFKNVLRLIDAMERMFKIIKK